MPTRVSSTSSTLNPTSASAPWISSRATSTRPSRPTAYESTAVRLVRNGFPRRSATRTVYQCTPASTPTTTPASSRNV
jgi:hypothetical protein